MKLKKVSKSDLEKLQIRYKTDTYIGASLGISRQAVHQMRKQYGIPSVKVHNPDRNDKILDLFNNQHKTVMEIARKMDMSIGQIYKIVKNNQPKIKEDNNGSEKALS
jgi:DNA-directed RNA polymerase specialized sigma subunit